MSYVGWMLSWVEFVCQGEPGAGVSQRVPVSVGRVGDGIGMNIDSKSAECLLELLVRELPDTRWAKVYREKKQVKWRVDHAVSLWSEMVVTMKKRGSPDFKLEVRPFGRYDAIELTKAQLLRHMNPELGWPSEDYEFTGYAVKIPQGRIYLLHNPVDVRGVLVSDNDHDAAGVVIEMSLA